MSSYVCFNRAPYLPVNTIPARWPGDTPLHIPNRMAMECQYQKDDRYADQKCVGCSHKTSEINQ